MEEFARELEEYDPDDPFEKWAAEETDYSEAYDDTCDDSYDDI